MLMLISIKLIQILMEVIHSWVQWVSNKQIRLICHSVLLKRLFSNIQIIWRKYPQEWRSQYKMQEVQANSSIMHQWLLELTMDQSRSITVHKTQLWITIWTIKGDLLSITKTSSTSLDQQTSPSLMPEIWDNLRITIIISLTATVTATSGA